MLSTQDKTRIDDTRIASVRPLMTPALLEERLPATEAHLALVERSRQDISRILQGQDDRLVVVLGPCSIHDHDQAMIYAQALQQAAQHHAADLLIVMRVYFEKPRTTQSHRQLASGLSCPVGFKNGTDGGVKVAADAVVAARASHAFMGMTKMGQAAIFETRGNPDTHIILRGGKQPNYAAADVDAACQVLHASGLRPQIMIDVSHANSSKQHARQITVTQDVAAQVAGGDARIMGVMIESHLNEGRQDLIPGQSLQHGISITDACISLAQTPRPSTTRQTQPTWRRCAAHAHHSHASYTCVSYDTHHAKALMMRRHTAIPLFF